MERLVTFIPDDTIFKHFHFIPEYLEKQIWNYCFLNAGLRIVYNGKSFVSKNGLLDLLRQGNQCRRTSVIPSFI